MVRNILTSKCRKSGPKMQLAVGPRLCVYLKNENNIVACWWSTSDCRAGCLILKLKDFNYEFFSLLSCKRGD